MGGGAALATASVAVIQAGRENLAGHTKNFGQGIEHIKDGLHSQSRGGGGDPPPKAQKAPPETTIVSDATVTPKGKPAMKGNVDLKPTLERIRSGGSFPHKNDGSVFKNKEGLLPPKPAGYYREWVHPTPGVSGPGPQRVVTGAGGELYYTPDHYGTFVPLH